MTASSGDTPDVPFDRNRLNFKWLLTLRWSSIAGQLATIFGVRLLLGISIPVAELCVIVAIEAASNLGCALWFRRGPQVHEWQLAAVMAADVALLTALLYFTGGPFNPFSFLYLVQIALAAVVLHAHWTWMLVALSFGSFGLLLLDHRELAIAGEDLRAVHARGMWVALGVASAFIVHFLLRATGALAQRERELTQARAVAVQRERLASLATMAAGAAHELATPLATIAVVAKELERQIDAAAAPQEVEDVRLIREQVARCRRILDQMAVGTGTSAGESIAAVTLADLLASAMNDLRRAPPVRLALAPPAAATVLRLPPQAVAQAVRNLITNAQDASPGDGEVTVDADVREGQVRISVRDRGRGMDPAVAARAGEPFFTTKAPGLGMGLGLFLTRAVVDEIGGQLAISSAPGQGTEVDLILPVGAS
ncbi:MAG TPA: ATP-binding protein [Kofleriaceae bacterium]|nr:ATP-binding protein [Kofleriaceae bacterium]